MYTCSKCGKKIFFAINLIDGLCEKCSNEKKHESGIRDRKVAETYLNQLIELHLGMSINIRTASFDEIVHAHEYCDLFIDKIQDLPNIPKIGDVIKDHAENQILWWEVPGLGRVDYDEEKDLIMMGQLYEDAKDLKKNLEAIVKESNEFNHILHSLHYSEIDPHPLEQPYAYDGKLWPQLQTYNVTARTPLSKLERFISLDIETTGLNPMENEIIQVSAIRFLNFYPIEVFSTYIKPRKGLNFKAAKTNHIAENQVSDAPYFEDIQDALTSFLAGSEPLVGHNISFDYNFLAAKGLGFSIFSKRKAYDTLDLSKRIFSERYSYSLDAICRSELKIVRDSAHDAVSDALATGLLFKRLCQERIGF